jgi:hypothetical protein
MSKKDKIWTKTMRRDQLVSPGDIIEIKEDQDLLKCRVLSCLAVEDGGCVASVVVLDGPRKGDKIQGYLKTDDETVIQGSKD